MYPFQCRGYREDYREMPDYMKPEHDIYLSVVVPSYNEENKIEKDIKLLYEYFNKQTYNFEIIIVNDGSKDKTLDILTKIKERHKNLKIVSYPENKGKGYAVKTGVLQATGKYILFVDAGYCVPFHETEKGINFLENGYDIAIGSRLLSESEIVIKQPFYRTISGRIFASITRAIVNIKGIVDTQCGFKFFKKEVAQKILSQQKINGFIFDVEVLSIAQRLGYTIKEFPLKWSCDFDTRLNPRREFLKILRDLVRIRLNISKISRREKSK